jgi:hypothetical protein
MNKMEMIIQKMVGVGKGKRQPENSLTDEWRLT